MLNIFNSEYARAPQLSDANKCDQKRAESCLLLCLCIPAIYASHRALLHAYHDLNVHHISKMCAHRIGRNF